MVSLARRPRTSLLVMVTGTLVALAGITRLDFDGSLASLSVADDPALSPLGSLSVGPDRLFLTVSEYESDVWAMNLRR